MKWTYPLIALLAALIPGRLMAAESVLEMQHLLESRIRPVVQEIDPKAHVFVTMRTKSLEAELPMTPFVYKDYILEDAHGQVQVQRLEVLVLSSSAHEFPASMKKLIRELTGVYAPITTTNFRSLPSDFAKYAEAFKQPLPPSRDPATTPEEGVEKLWKNFVERGGWRVALVLLGMFLVIACFLGARSIQRGTESIEYAVKGGVDRLLIAADKHVPELASSRDADQEEHRHSVVTAPAEHWAQISDDAFAAMLADCYWGEFDSYAAFLWRRIPLPRRKNVLARYDFLADFAAYLTWVREDDFGHEQEPYYLAPLHLGHLDNADLTEQVKLHPPLLLRLPALRLAGLRLDAKTRVELTKTALAAAPETPPDFDLLTRSARRRLARTTPMTFKNEAEEAELLSLGDVSPEVIESVPSLGWVARLGDAEIALVLGRFSARELATAWVGPEPILSRLAQQLPPKKLRLLQSFRRRYGASRQSPIFLRLHRMAAEHLKNRQNAREESKLRLAA